MDTFSLLASGVKFDRSRFAADISRFQPKQNKPAEAQRGIAQQPPHTHDQGHAGQARKRKRGSAPQQDQGPGIDVFTKSKINQQQPENEDTEGEEEESDQGPSASDEEEEQEGDDSSEPSSGSEDEEGETSEDDLQGAGHRHTGHGRHSGGSSSGIDPGCPVVATRDIQEAANVVRKHYRIKIAGTDPPAPLRSWQELPASAGAVAAAAARLKQTSAGQGAGGQAGGDGLAGEEEEEEARHAQRAAEKLVGRLVDALMASEPTPIQRQAIPCLLEGRELLAVAPTGSGKTLAFLVPLLLRLKALSRVEGKPGDGGQPGPRALLLSPTHELAAQQARVLRLLLPGSGLKGALLTKATATDNACTKIDILLANPLRVANMVAAKQLDLSHVRHLILDEADKLFDMGFVTQIDAILAACTHPDITRALFSATLPDKVEQLARSVLSDPLRVTVGARNTAVSSVKQRLLFVGRGEAGKLLALRQLLAAGLNPPVLVFVATKERAKALHRELLYDGVRVDSINAAQSHTVRAAAVDNFRSGRTWVLVATDLVGRGMDFIGVRTVVNFDVPSSTSDYIHRVGRTGRAHQTGEAVTFFTEEDAPLLRPIANLVKEAGGEVPEWMLTMKKLRTKDRRRHRLPDAVAAGATLSTRPSYDLKKKRLKQQGIQARQKAQRPASGKEQQTKQPADDARVNGKQIDKAKPPGGQRLQNGQRGPGSQKGKQRPQGAQANGSGKRPAAANGGGAARGPSKGQARAAAGVGGEAGGSSAGGRHKRPKLNQA